MRRLLIALGVLAVLAVGADRGGVWLAERVAAERAGTQGLHGATVDIRGVPFLTQLAVRTLSEVAVTGDGYRLAAGAGATIPTELTDVRMVAREVSITSRTELTAGRVTVVGIVPYAAVSQAAGADGTDTAVAAGTDDQVQVVRTVERLGRSVTVRALARLSAVDGQVVVRPTEASVDGAGPFDDLAADAVLPLVTLRYPVPALPEGLVLTGVTPVADGLAVTLVGSGVSLSALV